MSFRWFIYYCAVCGGCAALVGWTLGKFPPLPPGVLLDAVKASCVGLMLGFTLAFVDSLTNFAWKQAFLIAARLLTAGLVGGAAGLFGGLITGGVTRNLNISSLQTAGQILGWTLTGLLIGASVGAFDLLLAILRKHNLRGALRKVVHGLAGGAVGGLLGSLLYLILYGSLGSLFGNRVDLDRMWTPAAAGFTALGLSIGLLVGAAQVILKEAWIKVEAGFRPGRQLILSKGEIIIGRAESCEDGLFGDNSLERTHARIMRIDDLYLLSDDDKSGGTYLNGLRI